MAKPLIFELNPYGTKLIAICDKNPGKAATQLNIEMPGINLDYPHEHVCAITFERFYKAKGDRAIRHYIVVVIDELHSDAITLSHEAVHVVNYVFSHVGVEPDLDNDEHQAYMTSYVVECLIKATL